MSDVRAASNPHIWKLDAVKEGCAKVERELDTTDFLLGSIDYQVKELLKRQLLKGMAGSGGRWSD